MCRIYQNQKGKVRYNFTCQLTLGGITKRVSLGTKDKSLAFSYKPDIERFELATRRDPDLTSLYWKKFYALIGREDLIEIERAKNDPLFLDHFESWINQKYKMNLVCKNTYDTYLNCLDNLQYVFNRKHYLSDFSQDKYDELYGIWVDQGYKPATISIRARIIKAYFNWCLKRGILKVFPFPIDKVKIPERSPRFLYPDQFEKICNNANPIGEHYFRFLRLTGLRRFEVGCMERIDRNGKSWLRIVGKGNKERFVKLPKSAEIHYDVIKANPRVPNTLTQYFISASRKANVKARLHDLRHTFAFTQVAKGVSLFELQMMLGHSKSDTTMIYLKTDPDMLMDLVDNKSKLVDDSRVFA